MLKFIAIKFINRDGIRLVCLHFIACVRYHPIDLLSEHFYDPQMRCRASGGERLRFCKLDFIAGNRRVNYDSVKKNTQVNFRRDCNDANAHCVCRVITIETIFFT